MSIYNNELDADEEITHTKYNQTVKDANNSTDDIHPQYNRSNFYFGCAAHSLGVGFMNRGGAKFITKTFGTSIEGHLWTDATDQARASLIHSFVVLPGTRTSLRIRYNEYRSTTGAGIFNQPTAYTAVLINDAAAWSDTHDITNLIGVPTIYAPADVDIVSAVAGDVITVEIMIDIPETVLPTNNNDGDFAYIHSVKLTLET